jgi:hypothetical protein
MWDAGNVAIRFVGCRSPHAGGAAAVNAANAQSAILTALSMSVTLPDGAGSSE